MFALNSLGPLNQFATAIFRGGGDLEAIFSMEALSMKASNRGWNNGYPLKEYFTKKIF